MIVDMKLKYGCEFCGKLNDKQIDQLNRIKIDMRIGTAMLLSLAIQHACVTIDMSHEVHCLEYRHIPLFVF